ncbi:MAG TPA: hypothetical protein GXZ22_03750 [Clostridiaceae bacterium]|jgi:hypothetical protein|nr:hypothetical protein [Clostridiaceae bacterium]
MDVFIEKLVKRRKTMADVLLILLIVAGAVILSYLIMRYIPQFAMILIIGLFYLVYVLITKLNIEYEYAVTNGELDIDMITNQKQRKRLLSVNCRDFDVVAKVDSLQYTKQIKECKNIKDYTSRSKNAEVWFISMMKDGQPTVILFEPLEKMIENFAIYIPRKIFKN